MRIHAKALLEIDALYKDVAVGNRQEDLSGLAKEVKQLFLEVIGGSYVTKEKGRYTSILNFLKELAANSVKMSTLQRSVFRDIIAALTTDSKPDFNHYMTFVTIPTDKLPAVKTLDMVINTNNSLATISTELALLFRKYSAKDVVSILKALAIASECSYKD